MTVAMIGILIGLAVGEVQPTVEDRVLDNKGTFQVLAGGVWLSRFGLVESPGVQLAVTGYWSRTLAVDYLQASLFLTFEPASTQEVRRLTGLVPSSQWPRVHVSSGIRYAFGYGKVLLEDLDTVLHFVPEVNGHGGVLRTDKGFYPALDLGLALRVRVTDLFRLCFGAAMMITYEDRMVFGVMPSVQGGVSF